MARTWQLQEAKSRFSEVVNEALAHGPQIVSLGQFFRQSPLRNVESQ